MTGKQKEFHIIASNTQIIATPSLEEGVGTAQSITTSEDTQQRYFNREHSWLEFNGRVLAEAVSNDLPLLERLKFLAIFASNLDEFFMVRVAGLVTMRNEFIELATSPEGLLPAKILELIRQRTLELVKLQYDTLTKDVLPALQQQQVSLLSMDSLSAAERDELGKKFRDEIFPILTPLAVDAAHPFPHLNNLSIYLLVTFKPPEDSVEQDEPLIGLVEVPPQVDRYIAIPGRPGHNYVLLEDVIADNLGGLYVGFEISSWYPIRVTRNLDYTLLENEVVDLLKSIQKHLTDKSTQEVVRLEITHELPRSLERMLKVALTITDESIYRVPGPLNLAGLIGLSGLHLAELRDPPFNPRLPKVLGAAEGIFSLISKGDLLLHHPYDSFYPFIEFLHEAATDKNVLAIKITLYRTSGDSPIIHELIQAAQNGKFVTAVIELKARFDERANIVWARRLQRAGVNVVFGFVGFKTHAKSCLVVRREGKRLVRYVHLSTGNYNSKTAKLYTDIGLFTCDADVTREVSSLFNFITGFNVLAEDRAQVREAIKPLFHQLALAPLTLRERFIEKIVGEIAQAKQGNPARIIAKVNSLVDKEIIDRLYEASEAGVDVVLIVRGICCLRPGVKGMSERIRVISIIDRFLEHSRIFYFLAGGEEELYLSSADWMPRNMDRRVELMFPVKNGVAKRKVIDEILMTHIADNVKAWQLFADGHYERVQPRKGSVLVRSQERFIEMTRKGGIKSIPYDEAIRSVLKRQRSKGRPILSRSKAK